MSEKNRFKPWLKECWCIPPKANAEFVCAMEDVLEVYHRQFEDNEVLVCLDETSKQQVRETRTPWHRVQVLPWPTITNTSATG